jgi:hypothetical protein
MKKLISIITVLLALIISVTCLADGRHMKDGEARWITKTEYLSGHVQKWYIDTDQDGKIEKTLEVVFKDGIFHILNETVIEEK